MNHMSFLIREGEEDLSSLKHDLLFAQLYFMEIDQSFCGVMLNRQPLLVVWFRENKLGVSLVLEHGNCQGTPQD